MQLQQSSYSVLTTLRDTPRHGWSVLRELRTYGSRPPAVATIYATLDRLRTAELIQEAGTEVVDGRARVIFEITASGIDALHTHAQQMMQLAERTLSNGRTRGSIAGIAK